MDAETQTVTVGNTKATVLVRGYLGETQPNHDPLTGSGRGFAKNVAPYGTQDKRKLTPAWQRFRVALLARDAAAVVETARPLRSLKVRLDTSRPGNPNYGLRVSLGSWCLFCAPVVAS